MNQVAVVVHEGKLASVRGDDPRDLLRSALRAQGEPPPKLYATSSGDGGAEAARRALADGARLVVVCGGDGTVSACAAALAGTGVPMAVVPIGTGNLVARNLGIPPDVANAAEVAVAGADIPVDVGRIEGGGVLVGMAGVGLDAAMVQEAPPALKRRIGWPAYLVSLVRHLGDRGFTVEVEVDGEATTYRHVRTVVIGNVGGLHGGLSLFPEARPDDGVLDVAILAPRTVWAWPSVVAGLLSGRNRGRTGTPNVVRRRGRHIVVSAQNPLRREADGESLPDGRVLDIKAEPGALLLRRAALLSDSQ